MLVENIAFIVLYVGDKRVGKAKYPRFVKLIPFSPAPTNLS